MSANVSARAVVDAASRLMEAQRGLEAVEMYFSPDYIEHNPTVLGGNLDGFVQLLKHEGFATPGGRQAEFHTHHVFSEGEYVVVHQHVVEPGRPILMIMDIYRVVDGKIVEHWDVMQAAPENPLNTRVPIY